MTKHTSNDYKNGRLKYKRCKKLILDIANLKYPELRKSMQQDDKHIFINNYMFIILYNKDISKRCL
jgi:hypothetical protein